ncbi:hypothetical protein KJ039_11670 [bacterium]|nr:hypothetical protein [bacterium]
MKVKSKQVEINSLHRFVRKLDASNKQPSPIYSEPFSKFIDVNSNIILLGDPGSGKTHLLRKAAEEEGVEFLSIRTFLTFGKDRHVNKKVLYLDALDEFRTGTQDTNSITQIIRKLNDLGQPKIRLSCRAADWLGETDLFLFKEYFGSNPYVVLSLEPLTEKEILKILSSREVEDPIAFIKKAEDYNLYTLLTNPQTLIMLIDVVSKGTWPSSKLELFEKTVRVLLSESNDLKMRSHLGEYQSEELVLPAGAACASILISNVTGISLRPENISIEFPSYRTLPFNEIKKTQACLKRRAFSFVDDTNEAVSCVHRTIAEFLAAKWIKSIIQKGFPFRRVQNLICIKDHPASELRGLYAWLATLFSDFHSSLLIKNDPFGVLMYGDPGSLSNSNRKALLYALEDLSEEDPWFRSKDWSDKPLGAISGVDMIESFSQILSDKKKSYHLRSLVLDAISNGPQLPLLQGALLGVLNDPNEPFSLRSSAVNAILNAVPNGKEVISDAFRSSLANDPSIKLRAKIISQLYGDYFKPADVFLLLNDVLRNQGELEVGSFYWLADALPCKSIPSILDSLCNLPKNKKILRRNRYEVEAVFSRLLLKFFVESGLSEKPERIWHWLTALYDFCHHSYGFDGKAIGKCLSDAPQLLLTFFELALNKANMDEPSGYFLYKFKNIIRHSLPNNILATYILAKLRKKMIFEKVDYFLYEVFGNIIFECNDIFEEYYNFANGDEKLEQIRSRNCFNVLEEWHLENIQEKSKNQRETEARKRQITRDLSEHKESIRSGHHLSALGWLAYHYFGLFIESQKELTPIERIRDQIGEELTSAGIEGFGAVICRDDIPTQNEVALLYVKKRIRRWWCAIVAGVTEKWIEKNEIACFSDELLRSGLTISLLYLCDFDENDQANGWRQKIYIEKPDLAQSVFEDIVRVELKYKIKNSSVLYKLSRKENELWRGDFALKILAEFPCATPVNLRYLVFAAISDSNCHAGLLELCQRTIRTRGKTKKEQRSIWLAIGFLLDCDYFQPILEKYSGKNNQCLWELKNIIEDASIDDSRPYPLTIRQYEFLIRRFGENYANVSPLGELSAEKQAAEFVRGKIDALSSIAMREAWEALNSLLDNERLSSYHDNLKHAIANQAALLREAEFKQPSWNQTIETLRGGKPANIADLYALALDQLELIKREIQHSNTDKYKNFWNCGTSGRVEKPQVEEFCRDRLIELLKPYFLPFEIRVEPEGHMAADKSADIILLSSGLKLPLELKRDYHPDLWTACKGQLGRYTRDPEAQGYGIYVVFWFGEKRTRRIPSPPEGIVMPSSAEELEIALQTLIPADKTHCLKPMVIDVAPPD